MMALENALVWIGPKIEQMNLTLVLKHLHPKVPEQRWLHFFPTVLIFEHVETFKCDEIIIGGMSTKC